MTENNHEFNSTKPTSAEQPSTEQPSTEQPSTAQGRVGARPARTSTAGLSRVLAMVAVPLVVLGLIVAGAVYSVNKFFDKDPVTVEFETKITAVTRSLERQQKVVLLKLGIQGITEHNTKTKVWGMEIPGSGRTLFMQHTYDALLGVDGSLVTVTQTGENAIEVSIPEFIFIGYNNAEFKVVVEDNGAISFVTPEIDTATLITQVLDDKAKKQHIDTNLDLLRTQAETFYGSIIKGVDPNLQVTYKFASTK